MSKATEQTDEPIESADAPLSRLRMVAGTCSALDYSEFERIRDEEIAELAHIYWLLRGCPEGSPEVDWLKAELDIDQRFLGQMDLGLPT